MQFYPILFYYGFFLLAAVGSCHVCEHKEGHIFMSQIFNVLNYLQCPAWVSTQGPALSSASITLVTPGKAQGAEFHHFSPPSSSATFEPRATDYLLGQGWPEMGQDDQICPNQHGGLGDG